MSRIGRQLLKRIKDIVKQYSRLAISEIRAQWILHADEVDGEANINFKLEEAEQVVTAALIATGQRAWILEYGSGSLIKNTAPSNPFLDEYVSGNVTGADGKPLFNPARSSNNFTIVGRPSGYYFDLDGKQHYSTGLKEGESIEGSWLAEALNIPVAPRRIIHNVLFGTNNDGIIALVNQEINDAVADAARSILNTFPRNITIMRS